MRREGMRHRGPAQLQHILHVVSDAENDNLQIATRHELHDHVKRLLCGAHAQEANNVVRPVDRPAVSRARPLTS